MTCHLPACCSVPVDKQKYFPHNQHGRNLTVTMVMVTIASISSAVTPAAVNSQSVKRSAQKTIQGASYSWKASIFESYC